jgi:CBS domain-containing protein
MASNMLWCIFDWLDKTVWQLDEHPGENSNNLSSIFFDYELVFGELKIEDESVIMFFSKRE